jgi:4-hydroxy-3-methylbut-2-enyl diphosphate reductase
MKITIAKNAGFCFGVKRAYDLTCVNSKNCTNIYILGKLVHNNDVCADLKKRGIKEAKSIDDIPEGTIIFTAHGVGPGLYEKANAKGLKIIDTTCPKVIRAQRLAKNCAEKRHVVLVFGDKNHKEVKSVFEWSGKKAKVVGSFEEAAKLNLDKNKKYCLISQTTQNTEEFRRIIACLKKNLKNFSYFNTICPSTNDRQKEIRKLAKNNDAVIVIGGKDSANSKMLFNISQKINPRSYFVENAKQLKKKWFDGIKKIAIAAGASTPEWIIGEIKEKIQKI